MPFSIRPCGKQRFEIRVESGKLRCNEKGELTFNLHLKVQNKSCIGIDGQKISKYKANLKTRLVCSKVFFLKRMLNNKVESEGSK